jgi:hypothetical protein
VGGGGGARGGRDRSRPEGRPHGQQHVRTPNCLTTEESRGRARYLASRGGGWPGRGAARWWRARGERGMGATPCRRAPRPLPFWVCKRREVASKERRVDKIVGARCVEARGGGLLRATCVRARAPARAIRTVGWGGTLCGFDDAQQDEMLWIRSILSRLFRSFQFMMEQTRKLQKSTVDIRAFQGGGTSTSNGERIISISHYSYVNFPAVSRSIEI